MAQEAFIVEKPTVHLMHMVVFTIIVVVISAVLFPHIKDAFMANPLLNGLIIGALVLGTLYAYRMVWRLVPEANWLNGFKLGQGSTEAPPVLLAPMATILGDASGRTVLSPQTMRSLLDSLASRLDESRDLLRYLVGLLIFLGLLGTFWGLLATVTSVGDAIKGLNVSSAASADVFEELKSGLQKPLQGMGLSFSSSLFGLAGSLILGFLDLKASQAQNRFYHGLEDWLSTITGVATGEGAGASVPTFIHLDMQNLQRTIDRLGTHIDQMKTNGSGVPAVNGSGGENATDELADAVANLVQQMREEQKMVRQWIQAQQVQQSEIQRLLIRSSNTK
ncbi:flagellar motor protein MotA [Aestuariivirga litoralis]|uniref:flagellar motor protein MotA n=1 Tax=Aestuariivirga litoralis TaxID=2650924 RepID=UPI0018C641F4|nr:flagellar motor protein MotA [Aestuariivirga litoralis]MBG1233118.1 flagellar motor protein MotA [Aestuariivirga litoralis]